MLRLAEQFPPLIFSMASSSLLPRILLGTAIALTTVAGIKNFVNRGAANAAREELKTAQINLVAMSDEAKKAAGDAKTAKEELKVAAEAKDAADQKAIVAAAAAEKARKDLEDAATKAQELENKNKELEAKMNAPAQSMPTATAQDPELLKKVADAEAKAAEKEELLKTIQGKSEDAEKKAAALEADAARRAAGMLKPGLEGKVLAVNPNWNFVVLSIGDKQGVIAGASLIVKRGGSMVAKLHVTSVEPSTSIADIQAGSIAKGATIQPGDVVIFPGS